jgi:MFS-type transporter involved in bile tolerance (Atg22 family)
MILWGIGIGVEGSLLRALITRTVPASRRSTAFGLFDTCYGVAWFAGSAAMGLLYDRSLLALVIFSVVSQLVALPLFFRAR